MIVIPAKAGIQSGNREAQDHVVRCAPLFYWIPACAGMTVRCLDEVEV
jgi:hypothetical protein